MIEIQEVTKSYDGNAVVDRVSLTLPAGGLTSIIGPNGAGKSTLLSMVSRLMPMDRGKVLVDGLDVSRAAGDVLARRLSIMRQDNHITARLSVRDLVAFGRYPYSKGRLTVVDAEHIDRSIAYLGLEPFANRFLDELSGGQRQRAFIAMVLCQDTDYMLFDEPLNNLDIKHAVETMRLLRRLADDFAKTVVVVLHDINFASAYSDRIVAMQGGRLAFEGTPEDMIVPSRLEAIFGVDCRVHAVGETRLVNYFE
ncbi:MULTISPECIES: ATP-binding cassette domain-containing protein [unclassified Ensifer]|uniref:iron ABC transporter ATP-binding protein n=1 Tax=unclassified Ensifer TaxID=2633371 RepID=UPI0008132294|nr:MULTISPECIES: ATP-binding cassette domain-containing protein [unclassified Ensifer]OCP05507.1 iron ABC transporter ATP-binding protein [Ensifer sp. LC14]OCP06948.1 iron ABC transporter ATP-binding protein [Ensifer sp. LC11]OCP07405.1 iron ABC transporter ATP-binding protein [Ensifer sp. LC13]OCP31706.1 iron ABC transporter ATP-binding protein [Ensifer sp. LC499]